MTADLTGLVNQLQAKLTKMEVALGAIAEAIVWTGADNRVQWCNATFEQLAGRPRFTILGRKLRDLLPLTQRGQPLARESYPDVRALQGEYETTEYEFQPGTPPCPSRRTPTLVLEIAGSCVELADGDRSAVLAIRDITQTKHWEEECRQYEAALGAAQARNRSIFENGTQGIYQLAPDRSLLGANQPRARSLSYESAEDLPDSQRNPTLLLGITEEIAERKQREEALRLIVEGTASKTGDEFFRTCVYYLAKVLRVRYALISEFLGESRTRSRTLAIWTGEAIGENFEYDLGGTPCENASSGKVCYYPKELSTLFPKCSQVMEMGSESYLGIPLLDSTGNLLGHLAVMDVKPMEDDPGRELILKIFAARAGTELERKRAEEALRRSELKFRNIFENSQVGIFRTRIEDGLILDANQRFIELGGYSDHQEVIGKVFTADFYVDPNARVQLLKQLRQQGELDNFEVQFYQRDRSVRWGAVFRSPKYWRKLPRRGDR